MSKAPIKKTTSKKAKNKSAKRPVIALVDRARQKRSKHVTSAPGRQSKASKDRASKKVVRKEGKRGSSTDEQMANLTSHGNANTRSVEGADKSDLERSLTQTQADVIVNTDGTPASSAIADKLSGQPISFASPWLWNIEAINMAFRFQSSILQSLSRFAPVNAVLDHQAACYSMMVDALTALNRREQKGGKPMAAR